MITILLIEDNEMNRDMLSRRLERKGYRIVTAEDGRQGVDLAGQINPDIILMDLSLPVLDGWEATRILKGSARTGHIPVIALTAHAMKSDEEKAYQAGCDDFDTKPVVLDRLLEKMRRFVTHEG
ncbi:response regulator [Paenibacillus contaminans]|uniref:Response regulator n=1 Tax=Paenibacillus contaminans TaxID=450362 RepID=A0A329MUQ2_9BACL|nr:response regulator [Paenibacillus contaminans]RAV23134.1 response regulator [Paenibacillus contaminans]